MTWVWTGHVNDSVHDGHEDADVQQKLWRSCRLSVDFLPPLRRQRRHAIGTSSDSVWIMLDMLFDCASTGISERRCVVSADDVFGQGR